MESSQNQFRPVKPVQPAAAWVGGKRRLAERIVGMIEAVPHETYAEPFVGMGGVFLRRRSAPKAEVINDGSREVATFFRILQRHYPQFMDCLKFQISSRSEFERLLQVDPDTLTDLERSARFLYVQKLAYGGKVHRPTFGVHVQHSARFNLNTLGPRLEELHERLAGVVIECLPYEAFLRRYDRPGTLFYLDPPYYGCEDYYGKDLFSREDFAQLAEMLGRLKGQFILSLNDRPEVREIFSAFEIQAVPVSYTLSSSKGQTSATEVLITGGGGHR